MPSPVVSAIPSTYTHRPVSSTKGHCGSPPYSPKRCHVIWQFTVLSDKWMCKKENKYHILHYTYHCVGLMWPFDHSAQKHERNKVHIQASCGDRANKAGGEHGTVCPALSRKWFISLTPCWGVHPAMSSITELPFTSLRVKYRSPHNSSGSNATPVSSQAPTDFPIRDMFLVLKRHVFLIMVTLTPLPQFMSCLFQRRSGY